MLRLLRGLQHWVDRLLWLWWEPLGVPLPRHHQLLIMPPEFFVALVAPLAALVALAQTSTG
ncbi:MAG: hypothetical protein Q8O56_05700 [Solirubrobacteraceae bacterium]|nr:hypothetical protein [Solirubrobacteraceae bacterium]